MSFKLQKLERSLSLSENTTTKKVKPYPFQGTLDVNGAKVSIEIQYLSTQGFLANLKNQMAVVGQHYQVNFELPVLNNLILSPVRAIKTYDRVVDPKLHLVERLAEFHFQGLTEESTQHIVAFLNAIGQK